jgi:predicted N-formylglutamate amidohydrolase
MNEMLHNLLAADEPAPATVHNENGASPFLIVADHAGNCMPRVLRGLGISESEYERRIAWDSHFGLRVASPDPRHQFTTALYR